MTKKSLLEDGFDWRFYAKGALMGAVAVATVLETQEVPGWLKILARCVIGLGTVAGIGSSGLFKR